MTVVALNPADHADTTDRAEQAVIGAALIDQHIIDDLTAILTPADFHQPAHETIWRTITALHDRGELVDPITIADALDAPTLRAIAGPAGLADFLAGVTVTADAPTWAKIVHDRAVQRRVQDAGTRIAQIAAQGNLDPQAMIEQAQRTIDRIETGTTNPTSTAADALAGLLDQIGQPETVGMPTPWPRLNTLIGGLKPGRLYVIGGRPGEGKSMLAQNIAEHTADHHGQHVLFATVEMTAREVTTRILAHQSGVNLGTLEGTHQTERDWEAIERAAGQMIEPMARLHIDDTPAQTVHTIRATARHLQRRHGLGMIVVDYLQLLTPLGGRASSRSREQEVAEMSRLFKILAGDLDVPVVLLSQLNRALTSRSDKKPTMSDLRESGTIEQDADVVMLLWHPDPEGEPVRTDLIVEKNRSGSKGIVELVQRGWIASVDEHAPAWRTEPSTYQYADDEQED